MEENNFDEITDNSIEKPKRKMSEKQKEALKKGREKAHEKLRQDDNYKKIVRKKNQNLSLMLKKIKMKKKK